MATSSAPRPAAPLALLTAAVLQVVAPVVTFLGPGQSPAQGGGDDLLISPAGWAFAIWGPIYALAIAQAVSSLVTRADLPRRLVGGVLALYVAGIAWIAAAGIGNSLLTAAVLLVMAVAAIDAVVTLARSSLAPTWFARLTQVSVGLYAGWVTAALFVNVSTATVAADLAGAREAGWQLVVLLVAAGTALGVLAAARGNLAYAAASAWAFAGIAATTLGESAVLLGVVALVALVAVVATAAVTSRRTATPARVA